MIRQYRFRSIEQVFNVLIAHYIPCSVNKAIRQYLTETFGFHPLERYVPKASFKLKLLFD